jgi:predicted flap endonuclease-1-like 5' DNA nuclease
MKNNSNNLGLSIFVVLSLLLIVVSVVIGWVLNISMPFIAIFSIVEIIVFIFCFVWMVWLPSKKASKSKPSEVIAVPNAPKTEEPKKEEAKFQKPEAVPMPAVPVTVAPATTQTVEAKPEQTPSKEAEERGSPIVEIEGIGPKYAEKLNTIGIYTTTDLLKAGATPSERKELVEKTGISHKLLLKWINMADLFRIKGVAEEYSDLLEAAGVDTVVELALRVPEHLYAKILEVNEKKNLVRRPPALSEVTRWIDEAKTLPRRLEY